MTHHDVAIVGGGCIGLSVAKHLTERTALDVAVIEKEHHLAAHQSGRNSGVLHPGFNYPPDSERARFAAEGTRRMKEYCAEHGVPREELGVLVVAQDDREEERLHDLAARADANGVAYDLLESGAAIREHEPHVSGRAALRAPEAASVDARQYVYALARDVQEQGGTLYLGHAVSDLRRTSGGYRLRTGSAVVEADGLVNAAGLHADRLARRVGVGEAYRIVPFRGQYYELTRDRAHLCRTMIYPTPDPDLPFLGVHYTRRTDGKVIVGPNAALALGREAYGDREVDLGDLRETLTYRGFWKLLASPAMLGVAVDELHRSYRKEAFADAARRLVPELRTDDLHRSYAGVRAQIVGEDGSLVTDPLFVETDDAVHVLNAVSPGLTSSLPFGADVAARIEALV